MGQGSQRRDALGPQPSPHPQQFQGQSISLLDWNHFHSQHLERSGRGERAPGSLLFVLGFFFPPPCSSTLSCSASSFCHELFQPPFPMSRFPGVPARILGCRGSVVGPAWAQGSPAAPRWNFHCGWGVLTSVIHRLGRGSAFPSLPRGSGQVFAPVGSSWSRTCARGPSTQRPK